MAPHGEIQEAGGLASTLGADKGAAAAVPRSDLSPDGCGHSARPLRLRIWGPWGSRRATCRRQARPLQVVHEQCERAVQHHGQVSVGNHVTEQRLRPLELPVCLLVHGDPDQITIGASGATTGRRSGTRGSAEATGFRDALPGVDALTGGASVAGGAATLAAWLKRAVDGTRRMLDSISGCGTSDATRLSISRRLLCRAASSNPSQFSSSR
jgi:hypothetical protein